MSLRPEAHRRGALLHGLKGILDLMQTALGREDGVI